MIRLGFWILSLYATIAILPALIELVQIFLRTIQAIL
jgi:hypothetical protein